MHVKGEIIPKVTCAGYCQLKPNLAPSTRGAGNLIPEINGLKVGELSVQRPIFVKLTIPSVIRPALDPDNDQASVFSLRIRTVY